MDSSACPTTHTSGLLWARTRHATPRAGDPAPHDHVLIANLTEMLGKGYAVGDRVVAVTVTACREQPSIALTASPTAAAGNSLTSP